MFFGNYVYSDKYSTQSLSDCYNLNYNVSSAFFMNRSGYLYIWPIPQYIFLEIKLNLNNVGSVFQTDRTRPTRRVGPTFFTTIPNHE